MPPTGPTTDDRAELLARLRETTALLESIAADKSMLAGVPGEERQRLLQAVASVYSPDRVERRRMAKVVARERKAARVRSDQQVLHETGIRALRRKPVFHTPNVFPTFSVADGFAAHDVHDSAKPVILSEADLHEGSVSEDSFPEGGIPERGVAGGSVAEGGAEIRAEVRAGTSPDVHEPTSRELQHCYVCKQKYSTIHHFYDQLCTECAELNLRKRTEFADLRGRVALLTGGRVKIGYQAGIKLLRSGAHLIVTTRFPHDAAMRYAREVDFGEWGHRLEVFGLDLRHSPSVEAFCRGLLATRSRLDFIINNACQTVRRPPDFYAHMIAGENAALRDMPGHVRRLLEPQRAAKSGGVGRAGEAAGAGQLSVHQPSTPNAALLSQLVLLPEDLATKDLFPDGQLDQDLQQVDLRGRNSWRLLLAEVSTVELLEVQLVNAVAPFIFNARLKALMLRTPGRDKHIVNVSAVEGQFYRNFKTTRHPHTNMAKAALNMMTRTAAADYQHDGIHMNSVDTGWVTDEDPAEIAARKTQEQRFHPPLDIVDGAARIVDPIISGINTGTHIWGQFLKDYRPVDW